MGNMELTAIQKVCLLYLNNERRFFKPQKISNMTGIPLASVYSYNNKLREMGIIDRKKRGIYTLRNGRKARELIEGILTKSRSTPRIPSPPLPAKEHQRQISNIDFSPIRDYIKFFPHTTPSRTDRARNIRLLGTRTFTAWFSLNTFRGAVFPTAEGWEEELRTHGLAFILDQMEERGLEERKGLAIPYKEFTDEWETKTGYKLPPFEAVEGVKIRVSDKLTISFDRSQFSEGEICIHGEVLSVDMLVTTLVRTAQLTNAMASKLDNIGEVKDAYHLTRMSLAEVSKQMSKQDTGIKGLKKELLRIETETESKMDTLADGVKQILNWLHPPEPPEQKLLSSEDEIMYG